MFYDQWFVQEVTVVNYESENEGKPKMFVLLDLTIISRPFWFSFSLFQNTFVRVQSSQVLFIDMFIYCS